MILSRDEVRTLTQKRFPASKRQSSLDKWFATVDGWFGSVDSAEKAL